MENSTIGFIVVSLIALLGIAAFYVDFVLRTAGAAPDQDDK